MFGLAAVLLIWGVLLILIGAAFTYAGFCFFRSQKNEKKKTLEQAKRIDKLTQDKFNKIATLSIEEFDAYMSKLFSICMELSSVEKVSDKDPIAPEVLYAETLKRLMVYLGPETLHAIDYYYGENYLSRWCETRYTLLNNRGYIAKVVTRDIYADSITTALTKE